MPSESAMRAAKAIRENLNGSYFYGDLDEEIAEIIDREMQAIEKEREKHYGDPRSWR